MINFPIKQQQLQNQTHNTITDINPTTNISTVINNNSETSQTLLKTITPPPLEDDDGNFIIKSIQIFSFFFLIWFLYRSRRR